MTPRQMLGRGDPARDPFVSGIVSATQVQAMLIFQVARSAPLATAHHLGQLHLFEVLRPHNARISRLRDVRQQHALRRRADVPLNELACSRVLVQVVRLSG